MMNEDDLGLALSLARRAHRRAKQPREPLSVHSKEDGTPVTDLDRGIEIELLDVIASARPADAVLGEEFGSHVGSSRRWVIDPIDGTAGLTRGSPVWATLIALQIDEKTNVAVVSAPGLERIWWASAGAGAWTARTAEDGTVVQARQCGVSQVDSLGEAHFSFSSLWSWAEHGRHTALTELTRQVRWTRGFGDFWSHMLVAEGVCDVSAEPSVALWDVAAVELVVREAGGRVTALDGTSDGPGFLCTNGRLHEEVVDVLQGDADPLPLATRIDQLEEGTRP